MHTYLGLRLERAIASESASLRTFPVALPVQKILYLRRSSQVQRLGEVLGILLPTRSTFLIWICS